MGENIKLKGWYKILDKLLDWAIEKLIHSDVLMNFFVLLIVVVALTLWILQKLPIKFSPITIILKKIGSAVNEDIKNDVNALGIKVEELGTKVDSLDDEVESFKYSVEENHIIDVRTRILRFGDEIRHKVLHSQEHFEQIIADIDEYDAYCKAHEEFKNNKTVATTEIIKSKYKELLETNEFLD